GTVTEGRPAVTDVVLAPAAAEATSLGAGAGAPGVAAAGDDPAGAGHAAVAGVDAPLSEAELLRLAASLEASSEHPLADAIVRSAKERGVEPGAVEGFA